MIDHADGPERLQPRMERAGPVRPADPAAGGLTLAMLRSFLALARSLNLSEAARALGLTRQTLRRHIDELEALKGSALFDLDGRRYLLTPAGRDCLQDAEDILTWCNSWDRRSPYRIRRIRGFEHARYIGPDGRRFYAQQHSLGALQKDGPPLLRSMFRAWGESLTRIEHPAMAPLRPYLVLFRRTGRSWVFADVGERSAYARWFGLDYAQSARGALYNDDRAGDAFNGFISRAYAEVHNGGGIRLDHLCADLPRGSPSDHEPIRFQRILAGCVFPDGTRALAMLAVLTNRVAIEALGDADRTRMSEDLAMDRETVADTATGPR